jgi:hypothetical protein
MKKSRRIGAIVAMATTAVGVASMVASAPASAATRGPEPVSNWLRPVRAYTNNWVDIYWRTDRPVCDVRVRVAARGVDVSYAGHRRYASFRRGDSLRPGRTDYTSVQINPDFDRPGAVLLRAVITYDNCRVHARSQSKGFTLTLPVLRGDNPPGHGFPGWPGNGNGGPGDNHGGPGDNHGGPGDNHGGPGDNHGGPGDNHGGPGDNHGGPGDNHGGPGDNHGWPGGGHHNLPPTSSPSPTTSASTGTAPAGTPSTSTSPTPSGSPSPSPSASGADNGHHSWPGGSGNGSGHGGSGGSGHGAGGND